MEQILLGDDEKINANELQNHALFKQVIKGNWQSIQILAKEANKDIEKLLQLIKNHKGYAGNNLPLKLSYEIKFGRLIEDNSHLLDVFRMLTLLPNGIKYSELIKVFKSMENEDQDINDRQKW